MRRIRSILSEEYLIKEKKAKDLELFPLLRILDLYGVEVLNVEEGTPPKVEVKLGKKWSGNIITKEPKELNGFLFKVLCYILRKL